MATQFTDRDGRLVAVRSAGTPEEGLRVTLQPAAADVSMTTPLRGDDGSTETLESLAQSVGRGAKRDWMYVDDDDIPHEPGNPRCPCTPCDDDFRFGSTRFYDGD